MTENGLVRLKRALEAGRVADALDLYDAAQSTIGDQESRERALQKLARGIIARTDSSAQANVAARQFTKTVGVADQARIGFHVGFASFAGGNLSADQLASKVNSVIDAHDTVDQRAETMVDAASGVSLPPTVGVFGPGDAAVPKGETVSLEFTAENLGTVDVTGLDVSVEGYDLSASPTTVESLTAGESTTVSVSGPASEAGSFSVAVRLAGESAGDTGTVGLTVLDRGDFLDRALETLHDLLETVRALSADSSGGNAGGNGGKGGNGGNGGNGGKNGGGNSSKNGDGNGGVAGLENKVRTAIDRIEKLRDGRGANGKSVVERIESVRQLLDAFRNQTEALSGSRIPSQRAAVLRHDAGQAMSLLAMAAEAEA